MPPLNSRATRHLVRERNKLEGPRSLHRGLHLNLNDSTARHFKSSKSSGNGKVLSTSHRDLLVHHQKISEDLKDLYHRTSQLHKSDLTMEERIEEGWRAFERVGGQLPQKVAAAIANARVTRDRQTLLSASNANNRGNGNASLCVAPTAVPFAERLQRVSEEKKSLQAKAAWERTTHGEGVDYSDGSALHSMKDRRIRNFQQRQLKRAHLLRRYGDPTPLKQSGKFDAEAATFRVFNKTIRSVRREVEQDARVAAVKHPRHKRQRRDNDNESSNENGNNNNSGLSSMWDVRSTGNVNRPDSAMLRYSRDWELGPQGGSGRRNKRKRGRS